MSIDRIYFSKGEVASALGISERSVTHLISKGTLRSAKIGRRRLVHLEALKNFAGTDIVCQLRG